MGRIVERAYAKVNLNLYILGKNSNGYHNISSVMQTVDLYDEILLERAQNNAITLYSDSKDLPLDSNNTVFRSAKLLQDTFSLSGYKIHIKKSIPMSAGLGGPSADAAACIRAINKLENLGLSFENMTELGKQIGADVPFLIKGGLALCTGIGEQLSYPLKSLDMNILLVKPNVSVSTAWAYGEFDKKGSSKMFINNKLFDILNKQSEITVSDISKVMYNDFEPTVFSHYFLIEEIREFLKNNGALAALMSGSGSTLFGVFSDKETMVKCNESILNQYTDAKTFITKSINF